MENLLNPDLGLMITTIVTFLLLVFILTKVAWRPILDGLNKREEKIRNDLDRAEKSQSEAEVLRQKYETQLKDAQKTIQGLLSQAKSEGEKARSELIAKAREESDKIFQQGRNELESETERLKRELRGEVADLSMSIAEKIIQNKIDKNLQEQVMNDSLKSLESSKK